MEAEMKQLERRTRVAEEELQKIENAIQSILMEPLLARLIHDGRSTGLADVA
jgi:hypothetical protein